MTETTRKDRLLDRECLVDRLLFLTGAAESAVAPPGTPSRLGLTETRISVESETARELRDHAAANNVLFEYVELARFSTGQ
ncbi:hypothetical protein V8J82_15065 [Gymnodinialimonas sp. 2305UL16-5]|uniref:hypothetical protein n=1 Tax=Gymnodinialimonas mytili TaxID=3126503 RepID=UPI0030AD753A